ncbi:hypothetical protein PC116_g19811 [Phytophthora cactorum]|uniref:Uncharacterized protein n=1 Tax=Phytophthora cactorum TaxID=29920 RepID=A0A8T1K5T5_9STRA|nr:hypothetical protein PC111_g12168 [Phytophthora cactorum]KAG2833875.1 hypothetical protein PC112_g6299 [Phytophthora cactorum]KAG2851968.1 hypothetical protein PC113_g15431 [Phytophthora cactorum]KAG2971650.1 hypothetical protein PC118_g16161 [Phytophthora cactorum]KAG3011756.1 hypothetical protein PC119_g13097 [Phytophthora cactorum]
MKICPSHVAKPLESVLYVRFSLIPYPVLDDHLDGDRDLLPSGDREENPFVAVSSELDFRRRFPLDAN